jgi:hypothetical protein
VNACEAAMIHATWRPFSGVQIPADEDVEQDERHRDREHGPREMSFATATKIPSMTAIPRAIFTRRE